MLKSLATIVVGGWVLKRLFSKVIFGKDLRFNITNQMIQNQNDPLLIANEQATFIIVDKSRLQISEDQKFYTVRYKKTLQEQNNLCDGEKFGAERSLGYCTGIAFDNQKALTSARCIQDTDISSIALMFYFRVNEDQITVPKTIPVEHVIFPASISVLDGQDSDFAILHLDQDAPSSIPFSKGTHTPGTELYWIGYPHGLPQKYGAATVIGEDVDQNLIYSDASTFGGNSGSPVFEKFTHQFVGIHVRSPGTQYYFQTRKNQSCQEYRVYESARVETLKATSIAAEAFERYFK